MNEIETIKIREYQSNDRAQLLEIFKLNVPKYFSANEIDTFKDYLDHKIEQYFVVELGKTVVGGGGINIDMGHTGRINWDLIDPNLQGQGIGQKLLHYRIRLLKSIKGISSIMVSTSQLTYKFYEKNGFVVCDFIKKYWANGGDLYAMKYDQVGNPLPNGNWYL
ncbi:GNAT family N-acetyltransferase [Pedobacter sp. KBW06]|uniref:GNAT family N-acetyltransferase n=1 Tax=Pedobacter sp. KBW06 TaxID=2153359 RepID=UPI000F5B3671|nr:GNAT family N-acetyltransferase [Pedobacter sp. KBW06]RQO75566.1 GNAT family N-acetyltransferase [Pedobacter sp. KBW06]